MIKTLDYINILILTAIIALSPWFYGSVRLEHQYFIHLACLSALLIWLIRTNISKKLLYYPVFTPLFFFFGIALLSILYSVYRYTSILGILNLLSYIIIFFIVTQIINNEKRVNFFIWIILLTGLFYSTHGILQYYGRLPKDFWAAQNYLASRFVNSGSFAAFININIFLALGILFSHKNFFVKIISIFFLTTYIISLILTQSRLTWLIFVFILVLFLFLFWRYLASASALASSTASSSASTPTSTYKMAFIFIIIFGIIISYVIFQYKSLIWERLYVMLPTQYQSLHQRIDVWKGTSRIILSQPFGSGMGTFQHIYPTYRTHSDRFFIDYAHSDFFQIASELGILGLGAFIWFILRAFRQAFRSLFRQSDYKFFILLGLICAVLSFSLQSIFDFPMQIPANAILFFVTLSLLTGYGNKFKIKVLTLNKYAKVSTIIFFIISILLFTNTYLSKKFSNLAEKNFSKMRWQEAILNYNKAIKLMPLYADSYAQKGRIYALKTTLGFTPRKKNEFNKIAISNFKRAIQLNPYQYRYYLNLAWVYAQEGNQRETTYAFRRAIESDPTNGEPYYSYADYCLENNLLTEALNTYRKSLGLFINDDGRFGRLYGSIFGLFEKIYTYTQDYTQLKSVVPSDKLYIHLGFARFLETKNRTSEACKEYKDILTKFPDNETAKKAVKRLRNSVSENVK